MPDSKTRKRPLDPELAALSREEVLSALEREEEVILAAVSRYIVHHAGRIGEELKAGRDYLPLLTPRRDVPPLEAVAMEIVLEAMEEELAEEDEA